MLASAQLRPFISVKSTAWPFGRPRATNDRLRRVSYRTENPTEAVEQIRVTKPMEASNCNFLRAGVCVGPWTLCLHDRGEAYLEAGHGAAAAAAFQQQAKAEYARLN